MPDRPRPADLQFDDAAAATAIDELNATARLLRETEQTRATATTEANTEFRGAYADSFVHETANLDQEAAAALQALDGLRATIEGAVAEAGRRRIAIRAAQDAWDAEAAAERRRAEATAGVNPGRGPI